MGKWQTHDQHARTITLRSSLPEAMGHDGIQAFLRLLGRDGGTVGPLIQYLHTSVFTTDEAVLAATGGRYRATGPRPESMSPGRLAFAWSPVEQADCIQRDFPLLADLAWKALQAVTSQHIESVDSKLMRRYRIGQAAKVWLLDRPQTAIYDGGLRLQVRGGIVGRA